MIVSLAAGSSPTSSLSLTSSIQTMTGYIVEIAAGDAAFGSDIYYSIYAVDLHFHFHFNYEFIITMDL